MELDLGQQITLIGSTPEDRVMRAAFVPSSERGEPGVMEVVSEKNNPDDPSVRILDTLAIGETIQVRPPSLLPSISSSPSHKARSRSRPSISQIFPLLPPSLLPLRQPLACASPTATQAPSTSS